MNARSVEGPNDNDLEDIPPTAPLLFRGQWTVRVPLAAPVELTDTFDLLERQLQQLLLPNDVEVLADAGVLAGEPLDLCVGEMSAESHVELAREVVVEFGEELDVEKEHGRRGELVGDNVEEDFRAVVFVFLGGALFRAHCKQSHLDEVGAVAEEHAFSAWSKVSFGTSIG